LVDRISGTSQRGGLAEAKQAVGAACEDREK